MVNYLVRVGLTVVNIFRLTGRLIDEQNCSRQINYSPIKEIPLFKREIEHHEKKWIQISSNSSKIIKGDDKTTDNTTQTSRQDQPPDPLRASESANTSLEEIDRGEGKREQKEQQGSNQQHWVRQRDAEVKDQLIEYVSGEENSRRDHQKVDFDFRERDGDSDLYFDIIEGRQCSGRTKIKFTNAIRLIKPYGGDKMKIHLFIKDCERAFCLIKSSETEVLFEWITSHLEGVEPEAIGNREFRSWGELKGYLMGRYLRAGEFNLASEIGKFSTLKQGDTEDALSFYNRAMDYKRRIDYLAYNPLHSDYPMYASAYKELVLRFILGLRSCECKYSLHNNRPKTLEEALEVVEKWEAVTCQTSDELNKPIRITGEFNVCVVCKQGNHNLVDCPVARGIFGVEGCSDRQENNKLKTFSENRRAKPRAYIEEDEEGGHEEQEGDNDQGSNHHNNNHYMTYDNNYRGDNSFDQRHNFGRQKMDKNIHRYGNNNWKPRNYNGINGNRYDNYNNENRYFQKAYGNNYNRTNYNYYQQRSGPIEPRAQPNHQRPESQLKQNRGSGDDHLTRNSRQINNYTRRHAPINSFQGEEYFARGEKRSWDDQTSEFTGKFFKDSNNIDNTTNWTHNELNSQNRWTKQRGEWSKGRKFTRKNTPATTYRNAGNEINIGEYNGRKTIWKNTDNWHNRTNSTWKENSNWRK